MHDMLCAGTLLVSCLQDLAQHMAVWTPQPWPAPGHVCMTRTMWPTTALFLRDDRFAPTHVCGLQPYASETRSVATSIGISTRSVYQRLLHAQLPIWLQCTGSTTTTTRKRPPSKWGGEKCYARIGYYAPWKLPCVGYRCSSRYIEHGTKLDLCLSWVSNRYWIFNQSSVLLRTDTLIAFFCSPIWSKGNLLS